MDWYEMTGQKPQPKQGGDRVSRFVEEYLPLAEKTATRLNTSPENILGHWGMETGWGKSVIPGTNNLGNIKDFSGGGTEATDNMTGSRDKYRTYDTPDAFADDYSSLLSRRYPGVVGSGDDTQLFASSLQSAGYAEDSDYGQKVNSAVDAVRGRMPAKQDGWYEMTGQEGLETPQRQTVMDPIATLKRTDLKPYKGVIAHAATGFADTLRQLPELGWGLAAVTAAAVESAVGEGGVATAAKNFTVDKFLDWNAAIREAHGQEDYSLTKAWDKAKNEGDLESLIDLTSYGVGYAVGQGLQLITGAGAGSLAAKVAFKGAVTKYLVGSVEKEAVKLATEKLGAAATAEAVAKVAGAEAIRRQAVSNVAGHMGEIAANAAFAFGMEGGEIGGELVSENRDRVLSGGELARAFGATMLAGSLEYGERVLGLKAIRGKLPASPFAGTEGVLGRAARAAVGVGMVAPVEGATEFFQTGIESFGEGKEESVLPWRQSPERLNEAIDAAGLGAIGGAVFGGFGGAVRSPVKEERKPNSPLSNASTAGAAVGPQATPGVEGEQSPPDGPDGPGGPSFAERFGAIRARIEDQDTIGLIGQDKSLGPDAVNDLLYGYRVAGNQSAGHGTRERALAEIELFFNAFDARQKMAAPAATTPAAPQAETGVEQEAVLEEEAQPPTAVAAPATAQSAANPDEQWLIDAEQEEERDARLGEINRTIEWNRGQQTKEARMRALDSVLMRDDIVDYRGAFSGELARRGFADTEPTPAESIRIDRFKQLHETFGDEALQRLETVPSSPNEMDAGALGISERGATRAQQPPKGAPSFANIERAFNSGYKRQGKSLVHPKTGKKINLNNAELAFYLNLKEKAVDDAAHAGQASPLNQLPEPTVPQIEANNAKLGHLKIGGLSFSIENPEGSVRRDIKNTPPEWEVTMRDAHYGYIKGTKDRTGEHIDAFVKPGTQDDYSGPVYVIDQIEPESREFDEYKVMVGYGSEQEAIEAYSANFNDGSAPSRMGAITTLQMGEFRTWAAGGDTVAPMATAAFDKNSVRTSDGTYFNEPGGMHAVQEQSAEGVLPRQQEEVGETGGVRGRVGQGEQGAEAPAEGQTEAEDGQVAAAQQPTTDGVATSEGATVPPQHSKGDDVHGKAEEGQEAVARQEADALLSDQEILDGVLKAQAGERRTQDEDGDRKRPEGKADRSWIRTEIEALIKRKRFAAQAGRGPAIEKAIGKAKEYMAGGDVLASVFSARAMDFAKHDGETADILKRIADRIAEERKAETKAKRAANRSKDAAPEKETPEKETPEKESVQQEKARRGVERTLFNRLLDALESIALAPDKVKAAFEALLDRHAVAILDDMRDGASQEDKVAISTLYDDDGKLSFPPSFRAAVLRRAQRRWELAQQEKLRDPVVYQEALAAAAAEANIGTDGDMVAAFKYGFDHALRGKTKSTITGKLLGVSTEGYEAARKWIDTEAGRAWYEGKRARRLEDTGAKLRRWFDENRNRIRGLGEDSPPEVNLREIEKLTTRADLFRPVLAEGATNGAIRYIEQFRNEIYTFKESLFSRSGPLYMMSGKYMYASSDAKKILAFLSGAAHNHETRGDRGESPITALASLKRSADAYEEALRKLTEAFSGAKSVNELAERLEAILKDKETGEITEYAKNLTRYYLRRPSFLSEWSRGGRAAKQLSDTEDKERTVPNRSVPLTRPRLDRVSRSGRDDHRGGRNITPNELKETFGLADVGFGGWVPAKQDQDHVNYTYDALMDLAAILGFDPKHIGFGRRLYLTFGALGSGRHAAHFQAGQRTDDGRTVQVINLTNTKGDGTLAHEWFHALDYFLGDLNFTSNTAVKDVVYALKKHFAVSSLEKVPSRFIDGGWFYRGVGGTALDMARYAIQNGSYGQASATQYYKDAMALDKGKEAGKEYWGNDRELFARAGETFIHDSLGDTESDYLQSGWVADGKVSKENGYRGRPYPAGEERTRIKRYMAALVAGITWSDDGRPSVDGEAVRALANSEKALFEEAKQQILDSLPALYEAKLRRDKEAAKERRSASIDSTVEEGRRLAEEQRRREQERARIEAELAAQEARPEMVTGGELTDDDLETLFDESEAELAEEHQEDDGNDQPGDALVEAARQPTTEQKKAGPTTEQKKAGPTTEQKKAGRAVEQPAKIEPSTGKLASEFARLGVTGIDETLKGLVKLFGGGPGKLQSFPSGFDEDTYKAAKPHFEAALKAFKEAGRTLKDLFKALIRAFGPGVRPYAIRFAKEQNLGLNLTEGEEHAGADTGKTGTDDLDSHAGQGTETVSGTQGERDAGERGERPGDGGAGGLGAGRGREVAPDRKEEATSRRETSATDDGAASGGRDSHRAGDRVRGRVGKPDGRDGVGDFHAPVGSLAREGSWMDTAARNLDIIELVKRLDAEGRQATPEEQALLAKYTGFGASEIRNNLFPVHNNGSRKMLMPEWATGGWGDLVQRVKDLLTEQELDTLLQSTQYAHYTSEAITRSIWKAAAHMGFSGGRILEPGMGHGNFPITAPEAVMNNSVYTGIEMDRMTAAIARHLLPQENVLLNDFVKQKLPDGFFDIAIGNPPFADIRILDDRRYKRYRFLLHDYFFAKSIDATRPGGLLIFVTSSGTMDKKNARARTYLAERADLIGAIRLPQTAFKDNAGTEVVTDVLFMRKRMPGEERAGEKWSDVVEIETKDGKSYANEYFAAHPEMVLGTFRLSGNRDDYGKYISGLRGIGQLVVVPPSEDADIEALFDEAVQKLPADIYTPSAAPANAKKMAEEQAEREFDPKHTKEGGIYLSANGELMVVDGGVGVPVDGITDKDRAWLKDYVVLRDAVKQARHDQFVDGDWEKSLAALNKLYDKFVKKHGRLREFTAYDTEDDEGRTTTHYRFKNKKRLSLDVESPIVEMLERITEDDQLVKDQFLSERTVRAPKRREINSVQDAFFVSMDERGSLDLGFISELSGKTVDQVIAELGDTIYESPSAGWQTRDEYLSGDVVSKLEEAETAAEVDERYRRNIAALLLVQPRLLRPDQITASVGSAWIPARTISEFASEVMAIHGGVTYNDVLHEWDVRGASGAGSRSMRGTPSEWGVLNALSKEEMLQKVLNSEDTTVRATNSEGKSVVDEKQTSLANEVAKKIRDAFREWLWADNDRTAVLSALYNRKFNNLARRTFDGSHLSIPGLSLRFPLHPHQKNAIWRIIQTGDTYLAHAVGAGKTLEMIVSAMEQKRLGLIRKPLMIVPNHMLEQFSAEFMEAYPMANIMVADEEKFHTTNRRRFVAQAALNNPDAIIMTHSAFKLLRVRKETSDLVINKMIADLEAVKTDTSTSKQMRKDIEKRIERVKRKFAAKTDDSKSDNVVYFEELGVDFLYVDEAHAMRKLDFVTNRDRVKGIDPEGSAEAMGLYIKRKWLASQRPGRSMVMASGTPITNTMAELFTVMRFMDEETLEADGLSHFDEWANMFGESVLDFERDASGEYQFVLRFANFVNIPELMKRVSAFMDIVTMSQLGRLVPRPNVSTGGPQNLFGDEPEASRKYRTTTLAERLRKSRDFKGKGNPDPVINIITDGRLAAIDPRYVVPDAGNDPVSSLNRMIDKIIEKNNEIKDIEFPGEDGGVSSIKGATQIVFSPIGFGTQVAQTRGFDARAFMIDRLVKGGLKKGEIAFISDYKSHAAKKKLYKDMRAGIVKVLVGSPRAMGTGLNVQRRLKVLHYLTPPWFPADIEQPLGRILRQGNLNAEVDILWYAARNTYESTMWGMVTRKSRFIEQAMSGDDSVRKIEDVSESSQYAMASALSAGDERAIQLAGLQADIERLSRLEMAHQNEQTALRQKRLDTMGLIEYENRNLAAHRKAKEALGDLSFSPPAKIGGIQYDDNLRAWGDAVLESVKDAWGKMAVEDTKTIGYLDGRLQINLRSRKNGWTGQRTGDLLVRVGDVDYRVAEDFNPTGPSFDSMTNIGRQIVNKAMSGPGRAIDDAEAHLADNMRKLKEIDARLGLPFAHRAELEEKIAESAALKKEMAAAGSAVHSDELLGAINEARLAGALPEEAGLFAGDGAARTMASIGNMEPSGETKESIRAALVDRFGLRGIEALESGGVLTILPSIRNAPKSLRLSGTERAVYDPKTGRAYIFADMLTAEDAPAVLLHEVGEHYGLETMLGKRGWDALAIKVRAMAKIDGSVAANAWNHVKERYRRYDGMTDAELGDNRTFMHEVIARIGENNKARSSSLWKDLIAAVKRFLLKLGFAGTITENDVAALVEGSLKRAMREEGVKQAARDKDAAQQQRFMVSEARRHGFGGVDEFVANDMQGFMRSAERWRAEHPMAAEKPRPQAMPSTDEDAMASIGDRIREWARSSPAREQIVEKVDDLFRTKKTFNVWHRTFGTQTHKARVDPEHYGVVVKGAQRFLDDVSMFANEAADLAPDILPKNETFGESFAALNVPAYLRTSEDYEAIAEPIFLGTLNDRVFSDNELRSPPTDPITGVAWFAPLSDRQIKMYRQFLKAVNASLDQLAISEMARLARVSKMDIAPRDMTDLGEVVAFYRAQYGDALEDARQERADLIVTHKAERQLLENAAEDKASSADQRKRYADLLISMKARHAEEIKKISDRVEGLESIEKGIVGRAETIEKLKSEGYAPLMRFGRYTVDVTSGVAAPGQQDRIFFGMFETEAIANRVARELAAEYPNATIKQGVMSQESWKLFRGVTPETVELFAKLYGEEQSDLFQAYLKMAVNNRSSMKRLIHRMGIEGFSNDPARVLASFITSNARTAASNRHFGEMLNAVATIPKEKGDVKDEAVRLLEYIQNPREEASFLRSILFANFLGGSIASALTNMTQTFTTTLPYLSKYGAKAATKEIGAAMAVAAKRLRDKNRSAGNAILDNALKRAIDEGVVSPHEIHMLVGEAAGRGVMFGNRFTRAVMNMWGSLFSLSELYNREVAFIAAFNMATQQGKNDEAAYNFAKEAVEITQFVYSRAARPNVARGPIGAVLMTFKTFTINYLEFLKELPFKERMMALGVLTVLAGMSGLPGSDDLDDIIDTIAEGLGHAWDTKQRKREFLSDLFGKHAAAFIMYGISPFVPLDVQGRLSSGNIIPGSGALKRSETDKTRDALEWLGAAGGLVKQVVQSYERAQEGSFVSVEKWLEATASFAPKALRDLRKGIEMARLGIYTDERGRKIVDSDITDAIVKAAGFNPTVVAESSRDRRAVRQYVALMKDVRSDIHEMLARGRFENDQEKIKEAYRIRDDWNAKNPESKIMIDMGAVTRRVRQMRIGADERLVRTAPKEMRRRLRDLMEATP